MQNWDSIQPVNYELGWYSNMFSGKIESHSTSSSIDQCFNMKQTSTMDVNSPTPSPRTNDCHETNCFESTGLVPNNNNNNNSSHHHPLGFNPLTPPGLPNAILPSMNYHPDINQDSQRHENDSKLDENSLTPRNTPPVDVTPPKSPKLLNETLDRENDMISNSSEDTRFFESEDDELIRVPIYNSHGKMKNYKCKHCGFLAITKVCFWTHVKEHIKPEKMLQCPKCPFVTELKHHLEYHIRKHKNLKPFQCDKCNYSCVNKSMLNSHLKSHSAVYQYRCSDCDYATKYCHSFKLHLRKYEHKPGMVLDEDGTPNPSIVIDVYGTRRGPKMKSAKTRSKADVKREVKFESQTSLSPNKNAQQNRTIGNNQSLPRLPTANNGTNVVSSLLPNNLTNMLHQSRNISFLPYFNLNLQMIAAQQHAAWSQISPQIQQNMFRSSNSLSESNKEKDMIDLTDEEDTVEQKRDLTNGAMDLSQPTLIKANVLISSETQPEPSLTPHHTVKEEPKTPTITSSSSRRKPLHIKTEHEDPINSTEDNNHQETVANLMDFDEGSRNCSDLRNEVPSSSQDDFKLSNFNDLKRSPSNNDSNRTTTNAGPPIISQIPGIFECKYCDIYFKDAVLYTIHMGYHSCDDVFKCNMCGEKCDGPVGLFIHMARNAHS